MTDKQIIIDVCPYQGECSVSGCKRNDDGCFVRQLFEERNRAENRIVELNKSIQAKEQECEELKKQNNQLDNGINEQFSKIVELEGRNNLLKVILTKIKEIAEKCCINQATLDCENYDDCTQCGRISDGEGIQQILQKISEVEDET